MAKTRKTRRPQTGGSTRAPATHKNLKPGIRIYFIENENLGPSNNNVTPLGIIDEDGIIKHDGKIKVISTTKGDFIIIDETDNEKEKEAPISFFITYKEYVESGRFKATLYVDKILPKSRISELQPEGDWIL